MTGSFGGTVSRVVPFIVVAAIVIVGSILLLRPDDDAAPAPVEAPPPLNASIPMPDPFAAAQAEYVDAKERLRGALDEQAAESDPELIEPVEENLGFLEKAVVEVMMALAANPESDSLRQTLLNMYEQQVNLLQKALRLTSSDE